MILTPILSRTDVVENRKIISAKYLVPGTWYLVPTVDSALGPYRALLALWALYLSIAALHKKNLYPSPLHLGPIGPYGPKTNLMSDLNDLLKCWALWGPWVWVLRAAVPAKTQVPAA